jgi:hypothetical protein
MIRRRAKAGMGWKPNGISFPMVCLYALFACLSSPFPETAPGKVGAGNAGRAGNAATAAELRSTHSESGLAGNLSLDGEGWSDDDVDACRSSPSNRQSDGMAAFALLDSEFMVRKAAAGTMAMPVESAHLSHGAYWPAVLQAHAVRPYAGPALSFPHSWPAFLICDLPPPLPS